MELTVLVCGGGNGAHVMAGLAALQKTITVRVLSLYMDEAVRWRKKVEDNGMELCMSQNDGLTKSIRCFPDLITNNPSLAVPGADIIIISVPAFTHEAYLVAIAPYIQSDTIIVGLPSHMGFEFQCADILKEKYQKCAIVSAESLPWACRIDQFGVKVHILGTKMSLACSIINPLTLSTDTILSRVQYLLGTAPSLYQLSSYMAINLMDKSYVHPPIMYSCWKGHDGEALTEKPLFYQGIDETAEDLLTRMSAETLQVALKIDKFKPKADMKKVTGLLENFFKFYDDQIEDKTNLLTAFRTNRAYAGLVHPMKVTEDGRYLPDFNHRYLTEDVPFGMCVFKGIADIVGVATPAVDEVITWCQCVMGKEYIVSGRLQGDDVAETRAPQRYGYKTLEQLFSLEK